MQLFEKHRAFFYVPIMLKPRFVVAAEYHVHFELSFTLAARLVDNNRLPVSRDVAVVNTQQDVPIRVLLQRRRIVDEKYRILLRRTVLASRDGAECDCVR
jgi:hypothetical protein